MTSREVETIFRTLRSRLRGFLHVRYYGLSSEEHDDIIQDTCELLLKKPEKWNDNTRDYFPLMCEMVHRRANGRLRHYRMRNRKSEAIFNKYNVVLDDPASRELYELDAGLTERQTEIFVMKMQGYEYKDIMSKLGIAKSTVNTTLDVARKKLRLKFSSNRRSGHPIRRCQTE
jgi:RNA polymerase sigma factor (sigma-70 family)